MKPPRSIQLSVVTFPHRPLAPSVLRCLRDLRWGQGVELLDVLRVPRDALGNLEVSTDQIEFEEGPSYRGLVLRQLLEGNQIASSAVCDHEMHRAAAVGCDLDGLDALVHRIPLGSSALLVLVEAGWTELLLDAMSRAGESPVRSASSKRNRCSSPAPTFETPSMSSTTPYVPSLRAVWPSSTSSAAVPAPRLWWSPTP